MTSPELGPEAPQPSVITMLIMTVLIALVGMVFCSPKG